MKVINRTLMGTDLLRNLAVWVRGEVGCNARWIKRAYFRPHRESFCGRAWSYDISVSFCVPFCGAFDWRGRGRVTTHIPDLFSGIVFVTAHEMQHVKNLHDGSHEELIKARDLEPHCDRIGRKVMAEFQSRKSELMAKWCPAMGELSTILRPAALKAPDLSTQRECHAEAQEEIRRP
jgi:hypothetical protein